MNMYHNKTVTFISSILLISTLPVIAEANAFPAFDQLRNTYKVKEKKVNKPIVELNANYVKRLKALKDDYQKRADLDGALLIDKEIKAVSQGENLKQRPHSKLTELQHIYIGAKARVEREIQEKRKEIAKEYGRKLTEMASGLTRQGKLEDAVTVRNEVERVKELVQQDSVDNDWLIITGKPKSAPQIPDDAVEFDGHFYKAFVSRVTWIEAKRQCEGLGGYLVCLESAREREFVYNDAAAKGAECWLGGETNDSGKWTWLNGSPFRYKNWHPGRPRDGTKYLHMAKQGTWDGSSIGDTRQIYACEWERNYVFLSVHQFTD